ncbi:MAG: DUF2335 domain-containing protein [Chloroflexi bacterium]|nr:DUF2335 domain-containing protein [Chloroflexota bacterium]
MTEDSKENLPTPSKEDSPTPTNGQTALTRRTHIEAYHYEGPIPDPSTLQEYEKVIPGSADRILRMAERQAEHRQFLEKTVIHGDSRRAFYGLWVGAFVALCVLGGAIFLIYTGHDVAGAVIGGLDIVSLVSVFVYGTVSRRTERVKKAALLRKPSTTPKS